MFNTLGRALARVGIVPISLDHKGLMKTACKQKGLSDFGPDSFRDGLAMLMESIEADGRLNLFGRYFAKTQLVELLGHRLQLVDYRAQHPEVVAEVIRRPLFILGLPRTGTTLLYGLLAEDPANCAPLSWEIDARVRPRRPRPIIGIRGSSARNDVLIKLIN